MARGGPARAVVTRLAPARARGALAALTLLFGALQLPALGRMEDHGAGVLHMEFVATADRADEMLAEWGPDGRSAAKEQLYLDYPFLISYGLLLAGACIAVARRAERRGRAGLARAGRVLAVAGLAGAGFDALENASLLVMLGGHPAQPWPGLATAFASVKFALTTPALLYALIGRVATR
jgi:hypothetical protein